MRNLSMMLVAAAALFTFSSARAEVDAKAAKTFTKKCASCHGKEGKGDTEMGKKLKVPDFSAAAFQKGAKDAEIKSVIKDGKKGDKVIADHALGEKVGADLDGLVGVVRGFGK